MNYLDIIAVVAVVIIIVLAVLYFLNRKASVKMTEQQDIIDKNKTVQTIFVIDKKKDKIENVNLPKAVIEQMPRLMKFRKNYFVQAKIGPQILTFLCDKKVFNALPVKKSVKVELVGIYILGVASVGQKTENMNKTVYATSQKKAKKPF